MNKLIAVFLIPLLSINIVSSQNNNCAEEVYYKTEGNPKCEGGISKINEIFSKDFINYEEVIKLSTLTIFIDCNGIVSIIESNPKLSPDTEKIIGSKLNSIQWLPANQRSMTVNFETRLIFKYMNNNLTVSNELIEMLPPIPIIGKVVDIDTELPIPDIFVSLIGENQSILTNKNGLFQLFVNEDYANKIINISHLGYVGFDFKIPESKQIIIKLKKKYLDFATFNTLDNPPNKQPNLVNCTYKSFVSETSTTSKWISSQNTSFPDGKQCFENYITENFLYPKAAFDKNYEGIVDIELTINPLGKPENPIINGNDDFGIKEEVYSMVINMPYWKPAIQKNITISQNIKFKILFGNNKYWNKKYK